MIESLENKKVKNWTKLHQKKYRNEEFLLLDEKNIKMAKEYGYLKTLIYVDKLPFDFDDSYEVSREVLNKISKKETANIKERNLIFIDKTSFHFRCPFPRCQGLYHCFTFFVPQMTFDHQMIYVFVRIPNIDRHAERSENRNVITRHFLIINQRRIGICKKLGIQG